MYYIINVLQILTLKSGSTTTTTVAYSDMPDKPVAMQQSLVTHSLNQQQQQQQMPTTYKLSAPMDSGEFTLLLMASPIYQKLEKIKAQIVGGIYRPKGEGSSKLDYLSAK